MVAKKVSTPSNFPVATAQFVIGEVASNSRVPCLRSSVYNPIESMGKKNSDSEPITLAKNCRN